MGNNTSSEKWYYQIFKLLKLEKETIHGKVNALGVVGVMLFCIAYTAGDTINFLISSVADVIKTMRLGVDVHHPSDSVSVTKAVIPIVIVLLLCLLYLYIQERTKEKIDRKLVDKSQGDK